MLGGEGNQNVDSVGTISFQIPITTATGTPITAPMGGVSGHAMPDMGGVDGGRRLGLGNDPIHENIEIRSAPLLSVFGI